jgi:hypothetical protein
VLLTAIRRVTEVTRLWSDVSAAHDRPPPIPAPVVIARALRTIGPRIADGGPPLRLKAAGRLMVSTGDVAGLDVDAVAEFAVTAPGRGAPPQVIKAKWILSTRPLEADPTAGSESESLAGLVRACLRRAVDLGAGSLGLPEFLEVSGALSAQRAARIVVREAGSWCRINPRPAMIAFCVRDPALLPLYRQLIAAA